MSEKAVSHTIAYSPPQTPLFRIIPVRWIPYAELMRLDRPAGWYAFWWHYMIGLAFAACIVTPTITPYTLIAYTSYLVIWVLVFRGVVCTWNDNLDQEFDRKVARTKFRPIARGAISTAQAHMFTVTQLIVGAVMLAPFPPPVLAYTTAMTGVLMFYPLCKRITDFPQVVLGFGLAMPIFMCCSIVGVDLLGLFEMSSGQHVPHITEGAICLYLAGVLWTIIYDTVYAHQDINDDIKAGVKSLAIRLGEQTKLGLGVLSIIQVGLLGTTGFLCELSRGYYLLSCGGAALALATMLVLVDLKVPAECAWWFAQSKFVGASVVMGLLTHYAIQFGGR